MSSIPGYTLEAYLQWNYNITVNDRPESNFSVGVAEVLGNIPKRPNLTSEQFSKLVTLFEAYREEIEDRLLDFDEDNQSWRSYAGCAFEFIPEGLLDQGTGIIKE